MPAAVLNFNGDPYMPLELKGALLRHGLNQSELAGAILQSNGRPLSHAAMALLINWGTWPKNTPAESIRLQTEVWLAAEGVPQAEIDMIWAIDGDDRYRARQPAGVHLGQASGNPFGRPAHRVAKTDIEPLEVVMLSPSAKRHFKLFRDPFTDEMSSPDDVFVSAGQRYISEAMFQTAKNGGFLAVAGESGSGKSTLRKMLLERIRELQIRVIFPRALDKSRLSTGNICQAIVNDLAEGEKMRASLEGQARQVEKVLKDSATAGYNHVLLIEEAHDLSIATLKYLKRFYELEDGFRKLLSIVLIGQPELKHKLDERRHPEAREVIRRCEVAELQPLDANVRDYLQHKLGRQTVPLGQVFADDAFDALRETLNQMRQGVYPLVVNNLATLAMNRAAELGVPTVSADVIKEAAHVRNH
jgi:type II secretory pathway predicted ATPase ExeA